MAFIAEKLLVSNMQYFSRTTAPTITTKPSLVRTTRTLFLTWPVTQNPSVSHATKFLLHFFQRAVSFPQLVPFLYIYLFICYFNLKVCHIATFSWTRYDVLTCLQQQTLTQTFVFRLCAELRVIFSSFFAVVVFQGHCWRCLNLGPDALCVPERSRVCLNGERERERKREKERERE